MYRIKESGLGKKWCGDGIIILTHELSQRKLKKLFNARCEFIEEYEQETTSEETETSSSTAKENTADKSNGGNNGHKSNTRKGSKKHKAD
jgi:hypothetical protein